MEYNMSSITIIVVALSNQTSAGCRLFDTIVIPAFFAEFPERAFDLLRYNQS